MEQCDRCKEYVEEVIHHEEYISSKDTIFDVYFCPGCDDWWLKTGQYEEA